MITTTIEGWPDAIRCNSDHSGSDGSIFIIQDSRNPGWTSYWQMLGDGNLYYYITFNADGTYYNSWGLSDGCIGKSIKQLYSERKAFNFVSSRSQDNLTSMIANWPDAIRCSSDSSGKGGSIFIIDAGANILGWHYMYCQIYGVENRYLAFNEDGTYVGSGGNANISAECVGKPIKQLYSEGRAFNFVSSKIQDNLGITSIMPNWPDAIKCSTQSSNSDGVTIFIIHDVSTDTGWPYSYWQISNGDKDGISFNTDGTYLGSQSYAVGDCKGKSIKELYSEGKAFNFIANKTNNISVNYGMFSQTEYFVSMNKTDDTGFVAIGPNISWCSSDSLYTGDFNGDGKTNLLCNLGEGENYIMLSITADDASFVPMNTTNKTGRIDIGNNHNWCNASFQRLLIGDFNGDKKSDLLCSNNADIDQGRTYAMLSNGTGFYSISSSVDGKVDVGTNKLFCAMPGRLIIGNFDGVYGNDLLCNHPTLGNMLMVSSINETSKTTVFKSVNEKVLGNINMGNDQECNVIWCSDSTFKLFSGFFNDDNKADLLCNNEGRNMIMLSAINSSFTCDFTAVQSSSSSPTTDGDIRIPTKDPTDPSWCDASSQLRAGDIDGDGLTDLTCNSQGQNKIMFCEFKDSFTTFVSINAAQPCGDGSVYIANHQKWCLSQSLFMGDVNGDGLSDLWCNQNGGVVGAY